MRDWPEAGSWTSSPISTVDFKLEFAIPSNIRQPNRGPNGIPGGSNFTTKSVHSWIANLNIYRGINDHLDF